MKDVEDALLDFIRIFDNLKIPYAVMGGLAVRAYGVPRPTYDVDVTVTLSQEEMPSFLDAVEAADYTVPEAYRTGWLDRLAGMPLVKFRIYRPDRSVDVDIFIAETKFQRELMSRRRQGNLDIIPLWLVSPEDLVLLKLVAGRHRDLGDIDDVRMMLGDLDAPYMRIWGERLGIATELDSLLAKPPL
jgi:hypothetical protein